MTEPLSFAPCSFAPAMPPLVPKKHVHGINDDDDDLIGVDSGGAGHNPIAQAVAHAGHHSRPLPDSLRNTGHDDDGVVVLDRQSSSEAGIEEHTPVVQRTSTGYGLPCVAVARLRWLAGCCLVLLCLRRWCTHCTCVWLIVSVSVGGAGQVPSHALGVRPARGRPSGPRPPGPQRRVHAVQHVRVCPDDAGGGDPGDRRPGPRQGVRPRPPPRPHPRLARLARPQRRGAARCRCRTPRLDVGVGGVVGGALGGRDVAPVGGAVGGGQLAHGARGPLGRRLGLVAECEGDEAVGQ